MAVLKDIECRRCGRVSELMVDGDQVTVNQPCFICKATTEHSTHVGAMKLRVFITDFSSRNWSPEETQFVRAGVETDGEPVVDLKTGERIEAGQRYQQEALDQRRDEIAHADDRRRGKLPIVIDRGTEHVSSK